jgi:hypothetical protein
MLKLFATTTIIYTFYRLIVYSGAMPYLWLSLLAVLASARLTRLVTTDSITESLRVRIVAKTGWDGFVHKLIECPFCCGFWISSAVVVSIWLYPRAPLLIPLACFAVSEGVGLIAKNLDK